MPGACTSPARGWSTANNKDVAMQAGKGQWMLAHHQRDKREENECQVGSFSPFWNDRSKRRY